MVHVWAHKTPDQVTLAPQTLATLDLAVWTQQRWQSPQFEVIDVGLCLDPFKILKLHQLAPSVLPKNNPGIKMFAGNFKTWKMFDHKNANKLRLDITSSPVCQQKHLHKMWSKKVDSFIKRNWFIGLHLSKASNIGAEDLSSDCAKNKWCSEQKWKKHQLMTCAKETKQAVGQCGNSKNVNCAAHRCPNRKE